MFEDIFRKKKLIHGAPELYRFKYCKNFWRYEIDILNGAFHLYVKISSDGQVDTDLIEKETGEKYVLYKTAASGSFVGEVRFAIEKILSDISQKCFEPSVFNTKQARVIIEFVRNTYGDELEFLWEKFPDNAVWRRKDNKKWYGAILTTKGNKIGMNTDSTVEIIDLRMDAKKSDEILSRENYFPGWHMNKKSWYTLVLDFSVTDEELKERIAESYKLAAK